MRRHCRTFALLSMAALSCGSSMGTRPVCAGLPPTQTQSTENVFLTESIRAVIRLSSESTPANIEALARLQEEKPEVAALAKHVEANPLDVSAIHSLATAYLEAGLQTGAFHLYQQVMILAPDDLRANIGLALIWDAWENHDLALRYASRAATLSPSSPQALEALGRIHLHRRELDPALDAFLAAADLSPRDGRIFANVGYIYLLREDWQNAQHNLERAISLDGTLTEARNNLGVVLARMGDGEGALIQFMAVNDPAAAHNNLGVAYLGLGRWKSAREEFLLALSADPEYAKAAANLAEAELLGAQPANPGSFVMPNTTIPGQNKDGRELVDTSSLGRPDNRRLPGRPAELLRVRKASKTENYLLDERTN